MDADRKERITNFLAKQMERFKQLTGPSPITEHHIRMKHDRPIKQRYFPRNPAMQEIIKTEIDELLLEDRIEPSNSPYSSPIVLVRKKPSGWRLCIDYRQINENSIKDAYPLPQINHILDKLRSAKYISTIDLKQGYWQIPLAKASRPYTAFTVPGRGLFQWKVMPFGHHSAPATFQRALDQVIGPEMEPYAFAYLDDIIVIGETLEEHLEKLKEVFDRLLAANLKINPEKCEFFQEKLRYLGHVISAEGIHTDPDKIEAIKGLPPPTTIKELRRFLGIASWYRRFVSSFSTVVAPLTKLLRKNRKWNWGKEQQEAFEGLKKRLTEAPILTCPDFTQPFILQTDASQEGLGAVLCQELKGKEHVIAYASRTLNDAEQKYSVTEKECLAVVWGIRKMRPYLEGYRFTVLTDHQALRWLHTLENPSGRLARWAIELQQYDFEVRYRKGKLNKVADALSRQPLPNADPGTAIVGSIAEIIETPPECSWYKNKLRTVLERPETCPEYQIKDGKIYKKFYDSTSYTDDPVPWKLCVPKPLRQRVLRENHDDPTAGHLGTNKTIARIARYYYWPGMFRDVSKYVRSCESCMRYKTVQQKPAGKMNPIPAHQPWEIISSDFIGPFPRSSKGHTMVLVFQDKFTKWTEIMPLREATTAALIRGFRERIMARFGYPRVLITDNGTQYTSKQFTNILKELNIEHRLTPPYSPQANPTERANRVIKTMIAQYIGKDHRKWDVYLPELMLALNTSKHDSTGYSPAYLNFGRELLLPNSLYAETAKRFPDSTHASIGEHTRHLQEIFDIVRINLKKAFSQQSHHYNLRRRSWCPKIGELVLRRERTLSSASKNYAAKLGPRYNGPYTVSKILSPVVVQLTTSTGKNAGTAHVKDLREYHSRSTDTLKMQYIRTPPEPEVSLVRIARIATKYISKTTRMEHRKVKLILSPETDPCVRKPTQPLRPGVRKDIPLSTVKRKTIEVTLQQIRKQEEPPNPEVPKKRRKIDPPARHSNKITNQQKTAKPEEPPEPTTTAATDGNKKPTNWDPFALAEQMLPLYKGTKQFLIAQPEGAVRVKVRADGSILMRHLGKKKILPPT